MKKAGVWLLAATLFAGCQSDDPGPAEEQPLIAAGTYPVQVHFQYYNAGPDDLDSVYMDSLTINGSKDTITASLKYGPDHAPGAKVLGLSSNNGNIAVYTQPHPGLPTAWTLTYNIVNRKIEYKIVTQTNHQGEWLTIARSL